MSISFQRLMLANVGRSSLDALTCTTSLRLVSRVEAAECGGWVDVEELWQFSPVAYLINIEERSSFAGRRYVPELPSTIHA